MQRKKLSTTIGASSYAYLHNMVKTGRAESVGEAVDKAVEIARRLDNRATLERQTAAYFKGLSSKAAAEETDLEDALSAASQELDFGPAVALLPGAARSGPRCWEIRRFAIGCW